MLKIRNVLGLLAVLALVAAVGLQSTTAFAQQDTGDGNFIFVNYIGQEMTFDLDDVTYIIPGTDTAPEGGRLTLQLSTGEHKFAANVPGGGIGYSGEFTIEPGQTVAKAARLDQTPPSVKNDILLSKPEDFVQVFDFDPFAQPVEETPVVDTWQPNSAGAEKASLVWINYVGDELTIDLNGQLYKVAPPSNDIPGRLQIDVAPGTYRYTASVPAGSISGELTAVAGQVDGVTVYADPPEPRKYEIGAKFEFIQPLTMHVFEEDLTTQAESAVTTPTQEVVEAEAPATLPNTGGEITPIIDDTTVPQGILVKNFAGETLTFTINSQTYSVPNHAERTIMLAPGHYSYTASLPFVATTGEVDILLNQGIEMSVAINVAHDQLNVYLN